jgi:Ni/Fe-hydrogenase 1 B-type cytochrome subunit
MSGERMYVWELPVRLTHWVNVLAILVLSATGFYIGFPFAGGSVSLMAWVRGIHRLTAWVFVASFLLRIYWGFAGNQWASWRVLFPYLSASGRRGLSHTFLYYVFIRPRPQKDIGHNPLAGFTYSVVILLMLVEVVTGFALQSLGGGGWRRALFGWVFSVMGLQGVRLTHHLIMWLLLGFMVHHVYSAVLMDAEEKNGLLISMFTGYKLGGRRA